MGVILPHIEIPTMTKELEEHKNQPWPDLLPASADSAQLSNLS